MRHSSLILGLLVAFLSTGSACALTPPFPIGNGQWRDLWVDPVNGDDSRSGATRAESLRTVTEAWRRIPLETALVAEGVRIQLTAGNHSVPNYWEKRWGSFAAPILIQAADGYGTARLPASSFFDVSHLYLVGLYFAGGDGGDGLHCEQCRYFLLRGVTVNGNATHPRGVQEGLKVNQSQYVFVEDSDLFGAGDNALDFVAVQYGHIINSRIHDAVDWCGYVKGGAFDLTVEGNEFFDCGNGGFTVGQGTGFQFMTPPFLHYEGTHVRVLNNFAHDTVGAAFGVNGGYDVTVAYNTAWRVGRQSHVLEAVQGSRSCDGAPQSGAAVAACRAYQALGGWGTADEGGAWIPNRNVYFLNNLIYNPPDAASRWQQFGIAGPATPPADSGVPAPARADDNLAIRGNVIWNGPVDHPLGIEDSAACTADNTSCNAAQLRHDNAINRFEPHFVDFSGGDLRPAAGSDWAAFAGYALPVFDNADRPTSPPEPAGPRYVPSDTDRNGLVRTAAGPAGALLPGSSALEAVEYYHAGLNHYFMTANGAEQHMLDTTPEAGWRRTGEHFTVATDTTAPMLGVQRFYGDPVRGPNSHFYTASPLERDALLRLYWQTPPDAPRWQHEATAFAVLPAIEGKCASGRAVTRLYNNGHTRGDPNHRYATVQTVIDATIAAGWTAEGVVFCSLD
jgi:hypothetical protein